VASHKGGFIGKSGKLVNYIIFDDFLDFALYGSWEVLDRCKILVQGPLRISTPGKLHSENFLFYDFFPQTVLALRGSGGYINLVVKISKSS